MIFHHNVLDSGSLVGFNSILAHVHNYFQSLIHFILCGTTVHYFL